MKFLVFYDGCIDGSGREEMVANSVSEHISRNHIVFSYDYHNLPNIRTLINLWKSQQTSLVKEVAIKLLNYIRSSDAVLYLSTNINFQDQIPEDLLELIKLGFDDEIISCQRWNVFSVSCFVMGNHTCIKAAKTIWTAFREVELSRCLFTYNRPLLVEDKDVEESPCPSW